MKKKILIIFPDECVAYSSTVLNLVEVLSPSFTIEVISIDTSYYNNRHLDRSIYSFIKIPSMIYKVLKRIHLYDFHKFFLLFMNIRKKKADIIIGVDSIGLYIALLIFKRCHFLSLEIRKDLFFHLSNKALIQSVIIQTQERLNYLFASYLPKIFYIPNSHIYRDPSRTKSRDPQGFFQLVYFGNVIPSHGIYFCIDVINQLENVTLTLKGAIRPKIRKAILKKYSSLIGSGRLIIDDAYLDQKDITTYLQNFDAGFCFYDFNLIKNNDFNYISCPSGKIFNYLCSALPVIGSDILGLQIVKEFNAGILLKHVTVDSIIKAITQIQAQYPIFQRNCIQAAEEMDFHKNSLSFKNFLIQNYI